VDVRVGVREVTYMCRNHQEQFLSGVLLFISPRPATLHVSPAPSPQVSPVLSLYCLPLSLLKCPIGID